MTRDKWLKAAVMVGVATASGCVGDGAGDPEVTEQVEQALYTVSITGVNYLGKFALPDEWYTGGSHTFEVYGSFPLSTGQVYRPQVVCDGMNWAAQILDGYSSSQMNVSIPANASGLFPDGTSCYFMFELSNQDRANPSFSNNGVWFGPVSKLTITSATDGGVSGGWHYYTLYGAALAASPAYGVTAKCNGSAIPVAASVVAQGAGSTQVRVAYTGEPRDCTLRLVNGAIKSSNWTIRDGASEPSAPPEIGSWFWGGYQGDAQGPYYTTLGALTNSLPFGVSKLVDAGYRSTVRLVMHPTSRRIGASNVRTRGPRHGMEWRLEQWLDGNVYNLPPNFCPPGGSMKYLECATRSQQYQGAFNRIASGGTIVFTANDETSVGAYGWCPLENATSCNSNVAYQNANAAAIRDEYRAMTYALYETQQGTNRTFVIGNWETENQIYSGGLYDFVKFVRGEGAEPEGNSLAQINARVAGLTRWFQLRREGIQAGIAQAAAHNPPFTGVRVLDAVEIASTRSAQEIGYPSTLANIVPAVSPAYVTYSAWDSTGAGHVDEDLDMVEAALGSVAVSPITGQRPYLALGEFGIPFPGQSSDTRWRNKELVKAAYRAYVRRPSSTTPGPPVTILWQSFPVRTWRWEWPQREPNGPCTTPGDPLCAKLVNPPLAYNDDSLFDATGSERLYSRQLRSALDAYRQTGSFFPRGPTEPWIGNVTDLGLYQGRHYFELWGNYPAGSSYQVQVICDGSAKPAAVNYVNPNHTQIQINFQDPGSGLCENGVRAGAWCTFEVKHSTSTLSPIFGPRKVCPGSQGTTGQKWDGTCLQSC